MKILHLLPSRTFSGAENVACQIICMMRSCSDVEMVYCSVDGPIKQTLDSMNITFAPMKDFSVEEIKRVLKEQKPDIIHAHDMRAAHLASRVCKRGMIVSHVHNNNHNTRRISVKSVAYLWAARKARHIFWVSESAYNGYCFNKVLAKKSSVLYNIIDVEALYDKMSTDANSYTYDVAYLGRLCYPKNPERLLRVIAKAREKKPDIKVAIIGDGVLMQESRTLAGELGLLDGCVDFLGFQSNPLKILHDSKVMIMTSRYEGLPMVALEALALGVPIVSTPTDGLKEIINNGENGFLSDNDEELAAKIVELLTNEPLRQNLSDNAKEQTKRINNISLYKGKLLEAYKNNK